MNTNGLTDKYELIVEGVSGIGYAVIPGFIDTKPAEELLRDLSVHEKEGNMKRAGIGTLEQFQVNEAIRSDYIKWIDRKKAAISTRLFLERIDGLKSYLNRTCFLGLKDYETHFTSYPPGSFYRRHIDQLKKNDHRKISFICYLNKDWEAGDGGELRIYYSKEGKESFFDVEPRLGTLAVFRSDAVEHEVLLARKARYSITGWMLDQPQELTFL